MTQDDVDQYQNVKNNVIKIRNQSFFAHREDPDAVPETIIISLQFSFACAKDCEIPVTHELHNEPKCQNPEKNPFASGLKEVKRNQSKAVQT